MEQFTLLLPGIGGSRRIRCQTSACKASGSVEALEPEGLHANRKGVKVTETRRPGGWTRPEPDMASVPGLGGSWKSLLSLPLHDPSSLLQTLPSSFRHGLCWASPAHPSAQGCPPPSPVPPKLQAPSLLSVLVQLPVWDRERHCPHSKPSIPFLAALSSGCTAA